MTRSDRAPFQRSGSGHFQLEPAPRIGRQAEGSPSGRVANISHRWSDDLDRYLLEIPRTFLLGNHYLGINLGRGRWEGL